MREPCPEFSRNGLNDRIEELYQTSGVGPAVETLTERLADGTAYVLRMSLMEFKRLLADELARTEPDPDDSAVPVAVG